MDTHKMNGHLDKGLFIWDCPTCGRRVLIVPHKSKIVVRQGDPSARHDGGMGGVSIGAVVSEAASNPFEEWEEENAEALFNSDEDKNV